MAFPVTGYSSSPQRSGMYSLGSSQDSSYRAVGSGWTSALLPVQTGAVGLQQENEYRRPDVHAQQADGQSDSSSPSPRTDGHWPVVEDSASPSSEECSDSQWPLLEDSEHSATDSDSPAEWPVVDASSDSSASSFRSTAEWPVIGVSSDASSVSSPDAWPVLHSSDPPSSEEDALENWPTLEDSAESGLDGEQFDIAEDHPGSPPSEGWPTLEDSSTSSSESDGRWPVLTDSGSSDA